MKKLLLLLLLSFFSTQSLAKVGDVYYCEPFIHNLNGLSMGYEDGEFKLIPKVDEWELEPFSFVMQDKQIKFSDNFRWAPSMPYKFVPEGNYTYGEEFQGYDDFTNKKSAVVLNFVYTQTRKGDEFSFTLQYSNMVWVILADCEIL